MDEKILTTRKNGLAMVVVWGALYLVGLAALVLGGVKMDAGQSVGIPLLTIGVVWFCIGWIPFLGFKLLNH